jgi:hypothetical protein
MVAIDFFQMFKTGIEKRKNDTNIQTGPSVYYYLIDVWIKFGEYTDTAYFIYSYRAIEV